MIYLWMAIVVIVAYFIGSVNFARIVAWKRRKQDITTKGSFNPGTINMLRVYGFKIAIATMVLEFIKGGLPALIAGFVINHFYPGMYFVAYFTAGFAAVIGQIFPAIYGFKGGKGLATCAGVFFFSPLWWLAIICFIINFIEFYLIDYASIATLSFTFEMGVASTIYLIFFGNTPLYWAVGFASISPYWWIAIILLWCMVGIVFISHRKNIYRLFHKKENKSNFRMRIDEFIHKKEAKILDGPAQPEERPEKEIVIEDEEK